MARTIVLVLASALLTQLCAGQDNLGSLWLDNQQNATWCQWSLQRAAVIRDTLYIDGGALAVSPGLNDGTYGELITNANPQGYVYMLNFSQPFQTSANFTQVMTNMTKAGSGAANNIAPNFYDGAMLANDEEWFTYGGEVIESDAFKAPDADWVAKYMQYRSGPERVFSPGWQIEELPENITRYVTAGAAVSVPSEDLGYYFGGLRDPKFGPIEFLPGTVNTLSMTLVEVDLKTQNQETWKNITVPASVGGRANAELVWIPVGERGVLIALGGVVNPSFATAAQRLNASQTAESERISPGFMTIVAIYDIQGGRWYEQETSGTNPPQLTQGCTVVASAQDGSSHNIYWYGGYDGITLTSSDNFNDDVWVLSVPSFTWTKVKSGDFQHARARHRCVKPYPDQMFVVGGFTAPVGDAPKCVDGGIVQIFNLSSAEWVDSYDPDLWSEYTVPSTVVDKIGGSGTGGATVLTPSKGWSNSTLGTLFGTKYDNAKIKKWYPYQKAAATNTTGLIPTSPPSGGGTPSYLAPVLGVVLGLFFITLVVLAVLLWRRRKFLRSGNGTASESGTIENSRWIDQWLRGTPATSPVEHKAPTVTTDETHTNDDEEAPRVWVAPSGVHEAGGGQVYEMGDSSPPSELHGTGFVPLHGQRGGGLRPSPSVASHNSETSTVSHISSIPPTRPGVSPFASPNYSPSHSHDNSPPSPETSRRVVSDMSEISESQRGHLRGISETSVSTIGDYATPSGGGNNAPRTPGSPFGPEYYSQVRERERSVGSGGNGKRQDEEDEESVLPKDGKRPSIVSPLTPPGGHDGSDYIGGEASASSAGNVVRGSGSVSSGGRRKSNFQEGL